MRDGFVILVADRNRHVREFLQRELVAEGYRIQMARDGREVFTMIEGGSPPDLLILDLEIPYPGGIVILEELQQRFPYLPIVIHSFLSECANNLNADGWATVIEKSGNTDCLKMAVLDMLRKCYPERFAEMQDYREEANPQGLGERR
jgi:CheY-like chemotaxis protein